MEEEELSDGLESSKIEGLKDEQDIQDGVPSKEVTEQCDSTSSGQPTTSPLNDSHIPDASMATDHTHSAWDEDYEQVVVYLHKSTGYYFDPRINQYLVPVSYGDPQGSYTQPQEHSQTELPTQSSSAHSTRQHPQVGEEQDINVSQTTTNLDGKTQSIDECPPSSEQHGRDVELDEVQKLVSLEKDFVKSKTNEKDQSISSMLATVSDRVMERCGYEYKEESGMYYQGTTGLFYDQDTQLYFDPDRGCYYDYDPVTRQYSFHSRVTIANKEKEREEERKRKKKLHEEIIDLCSTSSEELDSPEEGEVRSPKRPRLPKGSPPPENEWAPCVRLLVTESECLERGSLYVATIGGVNIGREPSGVNDIKIPELPVSKSHAVISYDKYGRHFTVQDLGSANGTFLNNDQRLSEAKEPSKPHPLEHGDTLTLGSTTLSLHIHTGWETCDWCDPVWLEQWRKGPGKRGRGKEEKGAEPDEESLDLKRRKELNRIKRKYGLRLKDTYKNEAVEVKDGYEDRASSRRKVVGSDMPDLTYPDSAPSSVHRPISDGNRGRNLLMKMGWSEGAGLGKTEQGRTDPVQAQVRDPKSGLGSAHSSRSLDASGNPSSTLVRSQRMRKRFNEAISRVGKRTKSPVQ